MTTLVFLTVTMAAAAAGQHNDPYRGLQQFAGPAQFQGVPHTGQGPRKGPVGGPAPLDAVRKATEQFNRLYKEAAARAAAAPDDAQTYEPQQAQLGAFQHSSFQPHVSGPSRFFGGAQFSGPSAAFHAFGGSAPAPAPAGGHVTGPPQQVQDTPEVAAAKAKFFQEFNKRAQEAAAAPDDPHQQQQPPAFYRQGPHF